MKTAVITFFTNLLISVFCFFSPIKEIICLVALSTIIDTCFGIWKAKNLGEERNSKTFRYGFVPKILSYAGAVMLVFLTDTFILNEFIKSWISIDFFATKLLAITLISIEVKSMDESFEKVKGYSFIGKITKQIIKAKNIKKQIEE